MVSSDVLIASNANILRRIAWRLRFFCEIDRSYDAEDIYQEACLVLLSVTDFSDERGWFGYLLEAVKNRMYDNMGWRRDVGFRKPHTGAASLNAPIGDDGGGGELIDLIADESLPDIGEAAIRSATAQAVRDAVARLPDPKRQAIEYTYFEGLTETAAARRMGVRPDAVHRMKLSAIDCMRRDARLMRQIAVAREGE